MSKKTGIVKRLDPALYSIDVLLKTHIDNVNICWSRTNHWTLPAFWVTDKYSNHNSVSNRLLDNKSFLYQRQVQ